MSYATIIIRNVVTLGITCYYQWTVNKESMLQQTIMTGGQDISQVILDFDLLLESVYPHKQFTEFLRSQKQEMLPFLSIVRKTKVLRAMQEDLDAFMESEGVNHRSFSVASSMLVPTDIE